jgi:hypothetical protein
MTVDIREFFPECSDKVKAMISQTVKAFAPDGGYEQLLGDVERCQIDSFRFMVEVDKIPSLSIRMGGCEFVDFYFPINCEIAAPVFLDIWGLPPALLSALSCITVSGGKDKAVAWGGGGFISREVPETKP